MYAMNYYYSVMKKDEILSVVITWLDLEDAIVSEIRQIQKDTYCMISHMESNKAKQMETEQDGGCHRPEGWGKWEDVDQRNKPSLLR